MEETVKLRASVKGQEYDLTINEADGMLRAQINDRQYEIQLHTSEDSSYLLIDNREVFDCRVDLHGKSRERFDIHLKGLHHAVTIIDPRRLRTDENSDRHQHGQTEIIAQMPGKVVRVLVDSGAYVEKGAGIIIVEAMKMQNEMKSPRTGVVVAVNVTPGDTVNAGEILATIGEAG
jgi:biotin carboxyl carrier protein